MRQIILLIFFSIIVRAFLPAGAPFTGDEGLYAQEIDEMLRDPSAYTTYMGEYVPWKPPLMFYVYSLSAKLVEPLNLPIEIVYRLPNYLFSILTVVMFYLLTKNITKNEEVSFASALIFTTSPYLLVLNTLLMTDTLLICLLVISLFFYTNENSKTKPYLFLIGGLFAGLAFLTKSIAALIVIPLVIAYYYLNNKTVFKQKIFWSSFVFILFSILLSYTIFGKTWATQGLIDINRAFLVADSDLKFILITILGNLIIFFAMSLPWLPFCVGFLLNKKKKKIVNKNTQNFLLFWLIFLIFPFLVPGMLFWYVLPAVPAFIILTAFSITGKEFDKMAKVMFLALLIVSTVFSYMIAYDFSETKVRFTQKDMGEFLANKKNVAIITYYASGLLYYKFHNETHQTFNDTLILFITDPNNIPIEELRNFVNNNQKIDDAHAINYLKGLYSAGFEKPIAIQGNQSLDIRYVVLDSQVPDYQRIVGDGFSLIYNNKRYYVYEKVSE